MTYVTKAAIALFYFFYNLTRFKLMHLSFDEPYREREIILNCEVTPTSFSFCCKVHIKQFLIVYIMLFLA